MERPILFGNYCLLERVSIGGMAEVFRAKPLNAPDGRRYLALKRILPHLAEDDEFIKMFIDEARLTVQLRHPNIVQIYELGQFHSSYYILMEFIAGHDLLALQKMYRRERTVMDVAQACFIVSQIARGMDYAHRRHDENGQPLGIIHRDISPQNVLVSYDGEVKVIDFGIAKAAVQSTHTQVGVLKGKFGYMSPEQVRGLVIDQRSDVFAMGTLFWELLTNRRLFRGENEFDTLQMIRDPKVEPPSTLNELIPPEVDAIVMRSLAGDRDQRYGWASELADALDGYLATLARPFDAQALGAWMASAFEENYVREQQKHSEFQQIRTAQDVLRLRASMEAEAPKEEEPPEGATIVWAVEDDLEFLEIDMESEADEEPFGANHTIVQAGGFDLEQFMAEHYKADKPVSSQTAPSQTGPPLAAAGFAPQPAVLNAKLGVQNQNDTQPGAQNPFVMAAASLRVPSRARNQIIMAACAVLLVLVLSAVLIVKIVGGSGGAPDDSVTKILTTALTGGAIVVNVSPPGGLEVLVGGIVRGVESPVVVTDLSQGIHLVEVRRAGFETFQRGVDIRGNEVIPLEVALEPAGKSQGTLRLDWAGYDQIQVFVDTVGLMPPLNPPLDHALEAGQHLVEVLAPGYKPFSRLVDVEVGGLSQVLIELEPAVTRLKISTEPPTDVIFNGESLGLSPVITPGIDPTKVQTLELGDWRTVLGYPDLGRDELFFDLARLPTPVSAESYGYLAAAASVESGWQVVINGIYTGQTTPIALADRIPVLAGPHTVTLRRGDERVVRKIEINAGLTTMLP